MRRRRGGWRGRKGRRKEGRKELAPPKIRATALSWPQRKTTGLRIIRVGTGVANPETEEMQRTDLRKSRSSLDPRDKMKNIPSILRSRREMHS